MTQYTEKVMGMVQPFPLIAFTIPVKVGHLGLNEQIPILYAVVLLLLILLLFSLFIIRSCRRSKKRGIDTSATAKEKEISSLQRQLQESRKELDEQAHTLQTLELMLKQSSAEIFELAKQNDPAFLKKFQELFPDVVRAFVQKHPDLSKSERILSAMIFLHFTTKEIASYTFLEIRTIQTKKYRLKKKLGLPEESDLEQYILSFA